MTRRKKDFSRELLPDPKYADLTITRLVNTLMKDGKKSVVEKACYDALDIITERMKSDSLQIFKQAIDNLKPMVEVRSRRVGGATYQVPTEVRPRRAESLAIRWLVDAANGRSERGIALRLAGELMDASSNRGVAIKKREDTHRMAEANKAFSHFRW
jgi:small subunit ribosomal protein S7